MDLVNKSAATAPGIDNVLMHFGVHQKWISWHLVMFFTFR